MGFDLDAQRSGTITGFGMIEGGYFDISAGSGTVDVPTRMSKASMGFGIAKTKSQDLFDGIIATTDGDITNGWITFRRQSASEQTDLRVDYLLLGY